LNDGLALTYHAIPSSRLCLIFEHECFIPLQTFVEIMSWITRVLHPMASDYAVLAANALFSLAAVPLELFYLNTEEFGLWALIVQLVGYLSLIDLGMSAAVARLLVDYKDAPDGGDYGSVIL